MLIVCFSLGTMFVRFYLAMFYCLLLPVIKRFVVLLLRHNYGVYSWIFDYWVNIDSADPNIEY